MKLLLLLALLSSFSVLARDLVICRNEVMYNRNLQAIHRFTFSSHCQKALEQTRQYRGYFCDQNLMMNHLGARLNQFSFSSHCDKALPQSLNQHRLFCDNSKLYGRFGLVRQFSFNRECSDAIQGATFMGQICDDEVMINVIHGEIFRFTFASECKNALSYARSYAGRFCERGTLYDHYGRSLSVHGSQSGCLSLLRGESR